MRVSRLYVAQPLGVDQPITLDEDNAHYVRTVLRLGKGDPIILFNGQGGEFSGIVLESSRKAVQVSLELWLERNVESSLHIVLGLGISRGDRMDFSVQKAVELGVNHITPLITERCVVRFTEDKKAARLSHWQKIAQHAAEQSSRTFLPPLPAIETLPDWVGAQHGLKVFLDPYAHASLAELQPPDQKVTLLTGPEGGFSDHERETAKAAGFTPVRLGQRILRTETASLAALAAVQMLWGDFV